MEGVGQTASSVDSYFSTGDTSFATLAAAAVVILFGLTYGPGVLDDLQVGSGLEVGGSDSSEVRERLVRH